MVICLQRGADLHMAQLMPLPLTVSCFSEIHNGFTFLVPAHLGSRGKRAIKRVCVCVHNAINEIPKSGLSVNTSRSNVLDCAKQQKQQQKHHRIQQQ